MRAIYRTILYTYSMYIYTYAGDDNMFGAEKGKIK